MLILALDSGVERTGYSVFEKQKNGLSDIRYITSGLIQTIKSKSLEKRLAEIYQKLEKLVSRFHPDRIVVEQLFFFKNQKTAIKVSQAQGVVLLLAGQKEIPVEFLTPLQIKHVITGYGQADKKSVQKMLRLLLKLDRELKQDDQADAIACGLAYCYINDSLK